MPVRLLGAARRRLALDRNPMRRRGDRAATWAGALMLLVLLVAGVLVGAWSTNAMRRHHVATAHGDPAAATLAYATPRGDARTGARGGPYGAAHGGARAAMRGDGQAGADADVLGAFSGAGVLAVGYGVLRLCRGVRDRRRYAEWDSEWERIAPHWMRQY